MDVSSTTNGLASTVQQHLLHALNWQEVILVDSSFGKIIQAIDCNGEDQTVLPMLRKTKITMQQLENLYDQFKVEKIIMALIDIDGTIVYYNVYKGVRT